MNARFQLRSCKSRAMLVLHPRAKAGTLSLRNHFGSKPSPRPFPQTAHERPFPSPQLLSFLIHSGKSKRMRNTLNRLTFKSLRFHIHAHSFPASPMFSMRSPKQWGYVHLKLSDPCRPHRPRRPSSGQSAASAYRQFSCSAGPR
jgi:hypothetical protein